MTLIDCVSIPRFGLFLEDEEVFSDPILEKGEMGIWYYDLIAHFLGGICLALSALYILKNPKYIILITFILGVMWEIYEWYFNLTGHPFGSYEYNFDTIKDLIVDTIGAAFVWYIVSRNKIRK